ncbi:MAG: binding-protein-dependent transport system inner membrane protein [Bacillota bacterium]|nr:MAG: binding-protein-dependent transport system inner membrane protein [Bacillota bacterium]
MTKGGRLSALIFYSFLAASVAPLLSLLVLTVTAAWPYPRLSPSVLSWRYIATVFAPNRQTAEALGNSVLIAVLTTLLTLLIAVPAAKALGLYRFRGRATVKLLALMPLMVPSITVTMGMHFSMIRLGLTGSILGVVIIHTVFTLPYAIRVLTNVFELLGERHEVQAKMLGASQLMVLRNVTIPLIMPGLLSAATMSFIVSFTQYITTFLIGGGRILTIPLLFVPHLQSGEIQVAAVYSWLFIMTTLGALAITQGAVKKFYKSTYLLQP